MNISWFMKYKPKTIDDVIFENKEIETTIKSWISNKKIPGNILFYGKPGSGKSATAHVIINSIITNKYDLKEFDSRKVAELDDEIIPFIKKESIGGNQKIVLIEEIDKLSPQAVGSLKTNTLEKFQENTIVIATTNYINYIEDALRQRFTFKIQFNGQNELGILNRLKYILTNECVAFDENELKQFVSENINAGIRELINQLHMATNNNAIDFKNIKKGASSEEKVIDLTKTIITKMLTISPTDKMKCYLVPLNSDIGQFYEEIVTIVHNNYDINYDTIYDRLFNEINFGPMKLIIEKYGNNTIDKKFPNLHFISCLYELKIATLELTPGYINGK